MSLSSRLLPVVFACAVLGLQLHARAETGLSCPATIEVQQTARELPGWTVSGTTAEHTFERASLYQTGAGGREFDLAPDSQQKANSMITQTWNLLVYKSMPVWMRCHYRDTLITLEKRLKPSVRACMLRFEVDPKGKIVGHSEVTCH